MPPPGVTGDYGAATLWATRDDAAAVGMRAIMDNNGVSLDELLGDEPATEAQPETIGQAQDEAGPIATADTGETPETANEGPPPSEPAEPQHIPISALKDERAKRQALEVQLQQYQAYFEQANQYQEPAQEDDPLALVIEQVRAQVMPQFQQQALQMRVEMTETLARQKWQDYDDKVELFKEEAQRNPFLVQQVAAAPNPAEYAYNVASQIALARQYGSEAPPSRAELEAKIREEIMAEVGLNPRKSPPTSLASERSVGARSGPAWSGPPSLDDLLS
jgi:hypothetical protein